MHIHKSSRILSEIKYYTKLMHITRNETFCMTCSKFVFRTAKFCLVLEVASESSFADTYLANWATMYGSRSVIGVRSGKLEQDTHSNSSRTWYRCDNFFNAIVIDRPNEQMHLKYMKIWSECDAFLAFQFTIPNKEYVINVSKL